MSEALYGFERGADARVQALDIWQLPLRTVLSFLFLSADSLITGERFKRDGESKIVSGTSLLGRISYLAPFLTSCSLEIGADLEDAMSLVDARFFEQITGALQYAHFCEIVAAVRKGSFEVQVRPGAFILAHRDTTFTRSEERDVLLTELSLAFDTHAPPYAFEAFERMVEDWPLLNGADVANVLRVGVEHYSNAFREAALLSEGAYKGALGFERDDFRRVRAAFMSIADFCLGMAGAAEKKAVSESGQEQIRWQHECLEWAAPLLTSNFVLGLVQGLSGVGETRIDKVAASLIMDATTGNFDNAGEGYLPPLVRLGESFLFSPYALKAMMPERNLLYVLNKCERATFDELVSHHLEPALLQEAVEILKDLQGVKIKKNVGWQKGEIDLLLFEPSSNVAMQIQAKAALPPEGARMTRQVEARTLEAVDQLERFLNESAEYRDGICTRVFGTEVSQVTWVSAILTRSGLGTAKAWSAAQGIATLNPALLQATVSRLASTPGFSLIDFPRVAESLLEEIAVQTVKGWENERIQLFGTQIEMPLLELDYPRIAACSLSNPIRTYPHHFEGVLGRQRQGQQ